MPSCAIRKCKSKSGSHNLTKGGVSYHRFPNNPGIKAEWVLATGRQNWLPRKTSTICSLHFEPKDFVKKDGGRHYLHAVAVPTRNIIEHQEYSESLRSVPNMISWENLNNRISTSSIEVEIMPENIIIVNPQQKTGLKSCNSDSVRSTGTRTHEEDKNVMRLMQAKIEEQDLIIRKLKMRNHRLKRRLFSLKSMEIDE